MRAPYSFVPASPPADTLEKRVFASIDDLEAGLSKIADEVDIFHTQDCISARAAARVRDAGARVRVVRTVHHVDDFTTPALIDCQRKAIEEPDQLVVVSEDWRNRLKADYGVDAVVIHNGVDADRFAPIDGRTARRAAATRRSGGSLRVLVRGRHRTAQGQRLPLPGDGRCSRDEPDPATGPGRGRRALVPGLHPATATRCSRRCPDLGLELGRDVILAGSISDAELHEWYRSADALVFPSVKEGWGLAVLEAMAADLPVVSSDIAVLREYLTPDQTAVMTRAGRSGVAGGGHAQAGHRPELRETLVRGGRELIPAFSWERAAEEHARLYAEMPR